MSPNYDALILLHVERLEGRNNSKEKDPLHIVASSPMENLREYLESSSVHGVHYISACTSKATKAGWIFVVFFNVLVREEDK